MRISYSVKYADLMHARNTLGLTQEIFGELLGWRQQYQQALEKQALRAPLIEHEITLEQVEALRKAGCAIKIEKQQVNRS
jgi:hypothetical protein